MTPLFIRYSEADTGSRIVGQGLPDGTVWWVSPDVRLCRNGVATDRAIINQQHQIRVFVRNSANVPVANARVEVWPCQFGTMPEPIGSFPPQAFDRTACWLVGGAASPEPCTKRDDAPDDPCTMPAAGAAPSVAFFETNWTPLQSDIDDLTGKTGETEAHLCLIANCYGASPDQGGPLTKMASGLVGHDVIHNSHHGQRNITVATTGPGLTNLRLWAGNRERRVEEFVFEVRTLRERPGPLERFDLAGNEWFRRLSGVQSFSARLLDRLQPVLERSPIELPGRRPKIEIDVDGTSRPKIRVPIPRGKHVPLDVRLDLRPVGRPTVRRIDTIQRRVDGTVVGGARIVVLQLPRALLDEVQELPVIR
jgi:hypothetical protein